MRKDRIRTGLMALAAAVVLSVSPVGENRAEASEMYPSKSWSDSTATEKIVIYGMGLATVGALGYTHWRDKRKRSSQ